MGIETVINLRTFHSELGGAKHAGLDYEQLYMKAWHPEAEDAIAFLRLVTDPQWAPVLVHRQSGANRTGLMIAIYRVAVQGWGKDEALREMTRGGYGFQPAWKNLLSWFEQLDIEALRAKAGNPSDSKKQAFAGGC